MRLCLIIQLIFIGGSVSQNPEWMPELDRKIGIMMNCMGIPGMSLSVVMGDETIAKAYGVTGQNGQSANADTLFPIGSLSKSFTSALLAKYIAANPQASFDAPVNSYLSNPIIFSDNQRTSEANLVDLCGHLMGLPGHMGCLQAGFDQNITRADYMSRLQGLPPVAPFRDAFMYNNHMWNAAGHVAEQLGGSSWEELIRNDIFGPLGMSRSGFLGETPAMTNFANGWVFQQGQPIEHGTSEYLISQWMSGPAGSIVSSANDMIKWLKFQLSNGKNEAGETVVPETELLYTREPLVPVPDEPSIDFNTHYGMGWFSGFYRESPKLSHSGSMPFSHMALQTLVPEAELGVATMTSGQMSIQASIIAHHFVQDMVIHGDSLITDGDLCPSRSYIDEYSDNYSDNYSTKRHISKRHIPVHHHHHHDDHHHHHESDMWLEPFDYPELRPQRYAGYYSNPALGTVYIWINPQDGLLQFQYGFATGVLLPTGFPGQLNMNFYGALWPATQSDFSNELIPVFFYTMDGFFMSAMSTPFFDPQVEMIFERSG